MYSKGIENIVHSNGHISYIFSCELTESDFETIKKGYEDKEKIFSNLATSINNNLCSSELANLGYLIKNGYVDIKIAFTRNSGIFHDKFGIVICDNEKLYFRGSNNETSASIEKNYESFETTCSWNAEKNEIEKILYAEKMFDDLWNNRVNSNLLVIDIPSVIKNRLISFAQHKLVVNHFQFEDVFILSYLDNSVIAIDNLLQKFLDVSSSFYKTKMAHFVEKIMNNKLVFCNNISYIKIRELIFDLRKYSEKCNFNFYVTNELERYLNDVDIEMEKRNELGIMIKNKNSKLLYNFNEFCEIVNNELDRKLKDFQMWHSFHHTAMMRSADFSVPGAGKTTIAYAEFAYLSSNKIDKIKKMLIVCPISAFQSWKKEAIDCFRYKRNLKILDYTELKKTEKTSRDYKIMFDKNDIILINYEALEGILSALKEIINSEVFLVFDEVHRIKSIVGQRAKLSLDISKFAKYRLVLTGTPIPNGYKDLHNMLNVLFSEEYEMFFGLTEKELDEANHNSRLQEEISNKIFPFFCRATKDDLLIPEANDDDTVSGKARMCSHEKELFRLLYLAYQNDIFSLYIRLIQASTNPLLLKKSLTKEEMEDLGWENNNFKDKNIAEKHLNSKILNCIDEIPISSKMQKGIDLVDKISKKGPVIIWGIFVDTLYLIKKLLVQKKICCDVIVGNVENRDRLRILDKFENGEITVLITNPHTLGESSSFHKFCHQAVYFEYSFNLVHFLQSKDRIHRLGLDYDQVTSYYFLNLHGGLESFDSIDLKIFKRLKEKETIQENAINKKSITPVAENIENDILDLFLK